MFYELKDFAFRFVLGLLVLSTLFIPFQVLAQEGLELNGLEIDLWPEYDRPAVLVIYRIALPASTTLPANLTLRIPASVGEPHAVAAKEPDGSLVNIGYERVVNGEWAEISMLATMPELQLEYYDPNISRQDATRNFQYRWPGDYPVKSLQIMVQQPLGASNMSTSPALGTQETGQDGLVYHSANIGELRAGQEFDFSLAYDKATEDLSVANLQVQPSAPVAESTSSWRSSLVAALPWGLLILGVVLLVGGGVWYWQSGKRKEKTPETRRRRKPAAERSQTGSTESYVYCHSCGKRADPGDRFCRACGTPLRVN
jgi:hypothetical protein